jgi:hypothetical protein
MGATTNHRVDHGGGERLPDRQRIADHRLPLGADFLSFVANAPSSTIRLTRSMRLHWPEFR